MGNRAVILFGAREMAKGDRYSGVYLHWNGGPESVYSFVKTLASYALSQNQGATPIGAPSDALAARFTQLAANFFSSSGSDFLNVYAIPNPRAPLTNGDDTNNGLYVVHPDFSISRVGYGKVDAKGNDRYWTDAERLEEFDAVRRHAYWNRSETDASLMDEIRTRNDTVFLTKWVSPGKTRPLKFLEAELPVEKELRLSAELAAGQAAPRAGADVLVARGIGSEVAPAAKVNAPAARGRAPGPTLT